MAQVILLNGVSSAGKSTLARALLAASSTELLHVAMDDFIAMLPVGTEAQSNWFPVRTGEADGQPITAIGNGPRGIRLLKAMRIFVAAAADQALDLVVDDVCTNDAIVDYRTKLARHELTVVKVDAPLSVLERREQKRGDRAIGLAREQSTHIHLGIDYDLEIDTSIGSAEVLAAQILRQVS